MLHSLCKQLKLISVINRIYSRLLYERTKVGTNKTNKTNQQNQYNNFTRTRNKENGVSNKETIHILLGDQKVPMELQINSYTKKLWKKDRKERTMKKRTTIYMKLTVVTLFFISEALLRTTVLRLNCTTLHYLTSQTLAWVVKKLSGGKARHCLQAPLY